MNKVLSQLKSKKTVVVGLGNTGVSCAHFLSSMGCEFVMMDSRDAPENLSVVKNDFPNTEIRLGEFGFDAFNGFDVLILSPGIDPRKEAIQHAVENGASLIGDIELFALSVDKPIVAITGSNGKSTVTELVGAMARASGLTVAVGGNLGIPALDLINIDIDLYVLELSSFQLETVHSLTAHAAAVLNISEDHMDRYDSIQDYIKTKAKVYNGCLGAVVNLDDAAVSSMATTLGMQRAFTIESQPTQNQYGLRQEGNVTWLAYADQNIISVKELKIFGKHNYANALAALALGELAGLPATAMVKALRAFIGLPHRMEWVAEHNDVTYINDSKATNVGATAAAVQSLDTPIILIAGGVGKGQDFTPLNESLRQNTKHVVLLGRDADLISNVITSVTGITHVTNMKEAVTSATQLADQGDVVLLSPACASFDMYTGFDARGKDFCSNVKALFQEAV